MRGDTSSPQIDGSDEAWSEIESLVDETAKLETYYAGTAMRDPKTSIERIAYFLPHDCYHMGQIMYVRAWLGMKVIE